jgi:hypothetical protein
MVDTTFRLAPADLFHAIKDNPFDNPRALSEKKIQTFAQKLFVHLSPWDQRFETR